MYDGFSTHKELSNSLVYSCTPGIAHVRTKAKVHAFSVDVASARAAVE